MKQLGYVLPLYAYLFLLPPISIPTHSHSTNQPYYNKCDCAAGGHDTRKHNTIELNSIVILRIYTVLAQLQRKQVKGQLVQH